MSPLISLLLIPVLLVAVLLVEASTDAIGMPAQLAAAASITIALLLQSAVIAVMTWRLVARSPRSLQSWSPLFPLQPSSITYLGALLLAPLTLGAFTVALFVIVVASGGHVPVG